MRWFKLLLAKAYFDKGYSLTHYFFKLVAVFGLTSQMVKETFFILFFYSLGCYVLGRIWYKYKLIETENEIDNIFNPFQQEMRKKLGIPNKRNI